MTEEEIIDELEKLAIEWALEGERVGTTAEVTDTASVSPNRAFVVNVLLDYTEATDEAGLEGEREVSAVYGCFTVGDRFVFAYGADYPLIEPEDEEDEDFDDEEFADAEEE
jgi:hypothetical protein